MFRYLIVMNYVVARSSGLLVVILIVAVCGFELVFGILIYDCY